MKRAIIIGVILLVIAAGLLAFASWLNNPISLSQKVAVIITKGDRAPDIGRKLEEQGVIRSRTAFIWMARWRGIDRHLFPGRYEFDGKVSLSDVIQHLRLGLAVRVPVTIPEGWTIMRIVPYFATELGLNPDTLLSLLRDPILLNEWAPGAPSLEGYLWPDTYTFFWGVDPREVLLALLQKAKTVFDDSLLARAATLGMTRHQVLTLASMIEGEAAIGDERARIAGVFHNRLAQGWLLQCDPTVVYAMGGLGPDRPLQTTDLDFNSPYNTYLYPGLPPGPICNPGMASILASLYPDSTDEMYFVADGKGAHVFSRTLDQHNAVRARIKQDSGHHP